MKKKRDRPYVVAKCIGCGKTKKVYANEVAPGDYPMCDVCYMPMVAKEAHS
jgi:hypothetical protein